MVVGSAPPGSIPLMLCLDPIPGRLSGPWQSRGPDTRWSVVTDGGRTLEFEAGLGTGLHDGDSAAALLYDGDRVAAVVVRDRMVRAREVGREGIVIVATSGVGLVSWGVLGLKHAWSTWRHSGSLISVNGNGWAEDRWQPFPRLRFVLLILAVSVLIMGVAVLLGAVWWVGLASPFLLGGALASWVRWYRWRQERGIPEALQRRPRWP